MADPSCCACCLRANGVAARSAASDAPACACAIAMPSASDASVPGAAARIGDGDPLVKAKLEAFGAYTNTLMVPNPALVKMAKSFGWFGRKPRRARMIAVSSSISAS